MAAGHIAAKVGNRGRKSGSHLLAVEVLPALPFPGRSLRTLRRCAEQLLIFSVSPNLSVEAWSLYRTPPFDYSVCFWTDLR
jgi:hypothetical protein